jgi:ABC-type glycerol-3-phosphate transport system permease component
MLNSLQGPPGRSAYDLIMAGNVLSVLPMLIIFVLLQRYLMQGSTAGSVKG